MPRIIALTLFAFVLGASPLAHAQDNAADDAYEENQTSSSDGGSSVIIGRPGAGYGTGLNISVLGSFGGYGGAVGAGIGGVFGFPLLREGFIPSLNDSFHLEFGMFTNVGFYSFGGDAVYFSPFAGARWDFNIVESFTAFAAIRTGPAIGLSRVGTTVYFDGMVGGFWRFAKPVALRFELGAGVVGGGVSGGVTFWF